MIGVLFTITIDPHNSIACCASIGQVSSLYDDNEVLFSMYTTFRIIHVESINDSKRLYDVRLTPLSGNDPDLHKLTYRRQLPAPIPSSELTSWNRLGRALSNMRCYQKAEELYNVQLSRTTNDTDKGHIYQELAWNKCQESKFDSAIELYEKAIDIYQNMHPPNQLGLAEALLNIGHVYTRQNNYTKAIAYYQKAITIQQELLHSNLSVLAQSFDTLGVLYQNVQDYPKAISSYEKALKIRQQAQPLNLLRLADSYDHLGSIQRSAGDFSQAFSFYEKASQIREQSLPRDHIELAKSYKNLAYIHFDMNDILKALFYYQNGVFICTTSITILQYDASCKMFFRTRKP
ncbi:unnamed protein product [Adineta ricciae]|uniref:Uncharacterized protein n=1 Tax=Adineta ricciae TaxID=249248 RepID=A0A813R5B7_ADIRI|nr:unnamed protein product [Adineta ricciae]